MGSSGKKKKRRASETKASRLSAETVQEDIWAQCEICNKWRRLPPGSVVQEDAPWYCSMNPDKKRSRCEIDEEDWPEDEGQEDVTEGSIRSQGGDDFCPTQSIENSLHRQASKDRARRSGSVAPVQKHPRTLAPSILGNHQKILSQALASAAASQPGSSAMARFALDTWRSLQAIAPQSAAAAAAAANAATASDYFLGDAAQGVPMAQENGQLLWGAALASTAIAKGLVTQYLNDTRPRPSSLDASSAKPPLPPNVNASAEAPAAEVVRQQQQQQQVALSTGGAYPVSSLESSYAGNGAVSTPLYAQMIPVPGMDLSGAVQPQRPGTSKPPLPPSAPGSTAAGPS